jgi:hypothetical protein
MHRIFRLILGTSLVLLLASPAAAGLEAGKYARHYKGQEGIEVTIVNLKGEAHDKLVLVRGIESRIDDIPLLHTEVADGKASALTTVVDDKIFWTVRSQDSHWGGKTLVLRLPEDTTKGIHLYYDSAASKKVDAAALVARYEKSLADGAIKKIQLYQGGDLKPRSNGVFRRAVRAVGDQCGSPLGTKIEWSTIKGADTKNLPIATLCSQPARLLARACHDNPKKKLAAKISGITCTVGATQKLSLGADKRLHWRVPSKKAVAPDALASQFTKIFRITK